MPNCKTCERAFAPKRRQQYCSPECRPSYRSPKTNRRRGVVTDGYLSFVSHGHPRANKRTGQLAVHVSVAYRKYGDGRHRCHWCSRPIAWEKSAVPYAQKLVIDHVNGSTTDFTPENLVVSCARCNMLRGRVDRVLRMMTRSQRVAFLQSIADLDQFRGAPIRIT